MKATGSIAFIGTTRFQGHWNPFHNDGTASAGSTKYSDLMPTGSSKGGGGYCSTSDDSNVTSLTASQGDYWQCIGSSSTVTIDSYTNWEVNDWIVYSGSSWLRLANSDTLASVLVGVVENLHTGDPT